MAQANISVPRLVIGGVASGAGKTTTTVAIARALRARGLRVVLFKCGPDYLDPTYHARAVCAQSENLDGWMMGGDAVRATFLRASRGADIALIEGVMGLFDGESPTSDAGSTAEIARWLHAPAVLVVDAGGMARSAAAVFHGFASFDPTLPVKGAICNRVGSTGHLELLRKALGPGMVLGGLPRDAEHAFPERHLGLVTASRGIVPESLLDFWGNAAESWLDLDRLVALARTAPELDAGEYVEEPASKTSVRCRIGLAQDEAFHFYYADNLRRLEAHGATLVRFSPIRDGALPQVDAVYLGGGYPEVHAAALARNASMKASLGAFAARGGPIYAECGGLMYLGRAIQTTDGAEHDMVGLLPARAIMRDKLQALGYVETETQEDTMLGPAGTRFRGHQFRYSELVMDPGASPALVYSVRRRRGDEAFREGYRAGSVLASYVHAHFASNPRMAREFVESAGRFSRGTP